MIKCKTPKKEINNLSENIKKKCKKKIENIDKIIRKQNNFIPNKNLVINLLSDNKKKNKNSYSIYYTNLKNKIRLLFVVDNLKNITQNVPMNLMENLERDYQRKSKKIIKEDLFKKKINKKK
jgi:peroxiredoxin